MNFSSLFRPLAFFFCLGLVLSGCSRRLEPPAEVIYRDSGGSNMPIAQRDIGEAQAPKAPQIKADTAIIKLGLVVPLTGEQAVIGEQLRDAAIMGLYEAIENAPRLSRVATPELLVRDSGGNPTQTAKATEELIAEGVKVIMGPLLADNVRAASRVTTRAAIPMLTFSNRQTLAAPGVYVFGFSPEAQMRRMAEYLTQQQVQKVATIAPQDEYGRSVVKDFSHALSASNTILQPVEFFPANGQPDGAALTRITRQLGEWGTQRKALFLPYTGNALSASLLRVMGDEQANNGFLKLVGSGLWDSAQTLADPQLRGAWFISTDPEKALRYNSRFNQQYQYQPSRIASLAYDAALWLGAEAALFGEDAFIKGALTRKEGFATAANGHILLRPDGRVSRELAVIEISGGGFKVIDAAKLVD